jgi:hypothetical protein
MDFASCVKHIMAATDPEHRPDLNITLEKLDEILDRIAATLSFSSIDLRRRMKEKYAEPIRVNDALRSRWRPTWCRYSRIRIFAPYMLNGLLFVSVYLSLMNLKDLQNWRTNDGMDFARRRHTCVTHSLWYRLWYSL